MSDVNLTGGSLITALALIALLLICLVVLPIAFWVLEAIGVRIPRGLRTSGKWLMIALFVALICCVAFAVMAAN
jgi:hypothetical protein